MRWTEGLMLAPLFLRGEYGDEARAATAIVSRRGTYSAELPPKPLSCYDSPVFRPASTKAPRLLDPRPEEARVRIPLFKMERMQSTYENYVEYNLSESGVHPMRAEELLDLAPESLGTERLLATELGYCQSNGTEELRDRIALFYPRAKRENILVTNGGAEA